MARVTVALAVVISLTAAAPAARAAGGCEVPSGAHVKVRARHVVAYTVGDRATRDLYACLDSVGRAVKVTSVHQSDESGYRVGAIAASGTKLAYGLVTYYPDGGYLWVRLVDMRHPAKQQAVGYFDSPRDPPRIPRLVLARDGAVAYTAWWIAYYNESTGEAQARGVVESRDPLGPDELDPGPGVDLGSLERHGRIVSWLNSGERRSATLHSVGRCRIPPEAWVRGHTSKLVLYSVGDPGPPVDYYTCIEQTGTTRLIDRTINRGGTERALRFRLSGLFVGWVHSFLGADGAQSLHVRVFDARRGHLAKEAFAGGNPPGRCDSAQVPALALTPGGEVVWISRRFEAPSCDSPATERRLLMAWDGCGRRALDDDPTLYGPLTLAGMTVSWSARGRRRSAELRSESDC
jgi:hypothetical protein